MSAPEKRAEQGGDAPQLEEQALKPRFRLPVAVGLAVFTTAALAGIGAMNRAASGAGVEGASKVIAGSGGQSSASDQYGGPGLIAICHRGVTLAVSRALVPAHLARGDTVGGC